MSLPSAQPPSTIEVSRIEKLALELLREQRSSRRWRVFFRVCWLALCAFIAWTVLQRENLNLHPATGEHTAMVTINGDIGADTLSSADNVVASLKDAFEARMVKGIILRINSPGGSPVHAGIINDEITRLKLLHKKKVYVVVDEMAASAAYYIAAAADQIYVDKASLVGSIGVIMEGFGFDDAMRKYGVDRRIIKAGSHKDMLDPFSPRNSVADSKAQALVDEVHQQFIQVVRTGRGSRLKEGPDTFSGLVWSGTQAVKMGLADGFGNVSYVARELIKAENIVDYSHEQSVAERLARRLGAWAAVGMMSSLQPSLGWRWR